MKESIYEVKWSFLLKYKESSVVLDIPARCIVYDLVIFKPLHPGSRGTAHHTIQSRRGFHGNRYILRTPHDLQARTKPWARNKVTDHRQNDLDRFKRLD